MRPARKYDTKWQLDTYGILYLMTYRLYLDTSVFGAVFDEEDQERVGLTRAVLRRVRHLPYEAFVGTPVFEEIALAPLPIRRTLERSVAELSPGLIEEGPASFRLAEAYVAARLVPPHAGTTHATSRWRRWPILMLLYPGISGTW